MGYDLHITRAENWTDSEEAPITAEEWLSAVAADPELTVNSSNGPYFAVWNGTRESANSWLDWSDGRIHTKNPTRAELAKMLRIAALLGASVQGDDGEVYERPEDLPTYEECYGASSAPPRSRPWWQFW